MSIFRAKPATSGIPAMTMKFELLLVEEQVEHIYPETVAHRYSVTPASVADVEKNETFLKEIKKEAELNNLSIKNNAQRGESETSKQANEDFRKRMHNPRGYSGPHYFGGMPGHDYISMQTITYAAGSIAAFAIFARNVIGTAKDWRDLRAKRKIKVRLGDKEIEVQDGDDLLALLKEQATEAALQPPQLPRATE
ncbi:hypothetical protein CU048_07650 [Beijerinckiaceae bacterium]|nr:hypothetical protein CU048_07650 [Beijerinckiaceae bacterium]